MSISLQEVSIRKEYNDPALAHACIMFDFESDKWKLCFTDSVGSSIFTFLSTARGPERIFSTIGAANKVAQDIGFSTVVIDNRLEL